VGGGSNSIGLFHPFYDDKDVKFIGVEAGGKGVDTEAHSATLAKGRAGVLHGTMSYILEDEHGQIKETHSIAPGLDYPGVGPEHSFYKDSGRAKYVTVTDTQALEGFKLLSETEGIIPALEPSHAIYYAAKMAADLPQEKLIIVNLSGRGDKDLEIVTKALGMDK
jgi:tryptophan synthase beta subunit